MATKLTKPVTRESGATYDGRPLLVTLEPDDRVSVKPKGLGEGQRVWIEIAELYGLHPTAHAETPATPDLSLPLAAQRIPDGSTPYRISGGSLYVGERGPWIRQYGSQVYVSDELLSAIRK